MNNKKNRIILIALLLAVLVLVGTGAAMAAEDIEEGEEPEEIRDISPDEEENDENGSGKKDSDPEPDVEIQNGSDLKAVPDVKENQQSEQKTFVVTEYKSEESEQYLWDTISKYSPSDTITAGILAMFWRESFYRSDATAHWATVLKNVWYDQATEFTAAIDAGLADGSTREEFIEKVHYAIGGYGLGMWFSATLLEQFYDFAQEWGTSISDAEMQCAFAVESMKGYTDLWEELQTIKDPALAGARIGLLYDGSSSGYGYIGSQAKMLYEKYSENARTKKAA